MIRYMFLALSAQLASAAFADSAAPFATAQLFETDCIEALASDSRPDVTGYHAWSDDQVARFAEDLGVKTDGFSFWTPEGSEDVLIWSDTGPLCQVVHFGYDQSVIRYIWMDLSDDKRMRAHPFHSPKASRLNANRVSAGGWGTIHTSDAKFVQVSLHYHNFIDQEATVTMITGVRVGETPASCELFPEECS